MEFNLGYVKKSHLKMKRDMYNSMLNNQRKMMLALHQQNVAVVVPAPVPAPAPAPITSTSNKKLPKKGFNVVFSKIEQ